MSNTPNTDGLHLKSEQPSNIGVAPKVKRQRKKKLVTFFILTLAGVFLVLNILQLFYVSGRTKTAVEKSYIDDCTQITAGYSLALSHYIVEYENLLDRYANADIVQTGDETQIVNWLRSHASTRSPEFTYIFFCGPDGIAYVDTGESAVVTDRPYFKAIIKEGKETYVNDPVLSKTTGKPLIHIVHAAKVNGKTIGFFAGVVPVDDIQKAVSDIKLGDDGYGMLLAGDGTVIAHQDAELVMNKNLLTESGSTHTDITAMAKKMIAGETGTVWVDNFRGRRECIVYAPVEGTSWSFAFAVSDDQVHKTAKQLSGMMVTTALLILAVILALTGIIIFKSLKPLSVVESAINGIASGNADLTRRIEVKSNNEIGFVVEGFNRFTEKLQSIMTELKQSKDVLAVAGEDLHAGTQDTAAAIEQVLTKIQAVSESITDQSAGVEETAGAINQIASNIASLERMIEGQASGVTEASAAVEQMIGNIKSVNQSVEKMAASFAELEENSRSGAEKQHDVNDRIQLIENESEMLQEANTV
ncbi:MAG: methyl-accepting chemotaxis protein, partial [Treponema sp.]|nr:methyl-accepting chemotaxis protein [Treponema sp.]